MVFQKYKTSDIAISTLLVGIGASSTTLELQSGAGDALFPTDNFIVTLVQYTTKTDRFSTVIQTEKVLCTARVADTLTITRGFDGDTPLAFDADDTVGLLVVSKIIDDIQDEATRLETAKLNTIGGTRTGLTPDRLLYVDGTGNELQLAYGATGTVLQSNGFSSVPSWVSPTVNIGGLDEITEVGKDALLVVEQGAVNKKVKRNILMPTGSIMQYAGSTAPTGYLFTTGQVVSRATYADLFATIGTVYGAGDGSTTFALPNLQTRVVVGKNTTGTFAALGSTGGSETHTLTTAEMPAHTHTQLSSNSGASVNALTSTIRETATTNSQQTGSTGGGAAHNNLQPYIVLNYIIKL